MRRDVLYLEKIEMAPGKSFDQVDQRDLACIAFTREHAFAEKCTTHTDTVKSANELTVTPAFNTVGVISLVEFDVQPFEFPADPCLLPAGTRGRTCINDMSERGVDRYLELAASYGLFETSWNMKGIKGNDSPMFRVIPTHALAFSGVPHGKHAHFVGSKQETGCGIVKQVRLLGHGSGSLS